MILLDRSLKIRSTSWWCFLWRKRWLEPSDHAACDKWLLKSRGSEYCMFLFRVGKGGVELFHDWRNEIFKEFAADVAMQATSPWACWTQVASASWQSAMGAFWAQLRCQITQSFRYLYKMAVLYLMRLFWGWGFPYKSYAYSVHQPVCRWVAPFLVPNLGDRRCQFGPKITWAHQIFVLPCFILLGRGGSSSWCEVCVCGWSTRGSEGEGHLLLSNRQ